MQLFRRRVNEPLRFRLFDLTYFLPVQISSFLRSTTGRFSETETFRVQLAHGLDEPSRGSRAFGHTVKVVHLTLKDHGSLLVRDDGGQAASVSQSFSLRVHPLELFGWRCWRHQVWTVTTMTAAQIEPNLFRHFRDWGRQQQRVAATAVALKIEWTNLIHKITSLYRNI